MCLRNVSQIVTFLLENILVISLRLLFLLDTKITDKYSFRNVLKMFTIKASY